MPIFVDKAEPIRMLEDWNLRASALQNRHTIDIDIVSNNGDTLMKFISPLVIFQPDPTRNDIRIVSDDEILFYFVISAVKRTRQFLAYEGSPQITRVNALKRPIRYKITIKVKEDVDPQAYIRGLYRLIDYALLAV